MLGHQVLVDPLAGQSLLELVPNDLPKGFTAALGTGNPLRNGLSRLHFPLNLDLFSDMIAPGYGNEILTNTMNARDGQKDG